MADAQPNTIKNHQKQQLVLVGSLQRAALAEYVTPESIPLFGLTTSASWLFATLQVIIATEPAYETMTGFVGARTLQNNQPDWVDLTPTVWCLSQPSLHSCSRGGAWSTMKLWSWWLLNVNLASFISWRCLQGRHSSKSTPKPQSCMGPVRGLEDWPALTSSTQWDD